MRQIRQGVFETNSSSVHAICIATNPNSYRVKATPISLSFEKFGWEWDLHRDAQTKANYAVTALFQSYRHDKEHVVEKVKEFQSWLEEEKVYRNDWNNYKMLTNAIFGESLYCAINYPEDGEYWHLPDNVSGIDHGYETKEFVDYVFASKERMWNFLFSDDSFIQTGNDNDEDYEGIDLDDIKYDHEIFIKGN